MPGGIPALLHAEKATPPRRGPGRPPTQPWLGRDVRDDLVRINTWRGDGSWLAQQDTVPEAAFQRLMSREQVPIELWPAFRVVGRHWRHRIYRLTSREQRRLGELALELQKRPDHEWAETKEDQKLARELARLHEKQHGRPKAREMALSLTRGEPMSSLARVRPPTRLLRLYLALDGWGAARHDVAVSTWRRWRRLAVAADERLPPDQQLLKGLSRQQIIANIF